MCNKASKNIIYFSLLSRDRKRFGLADRRMTSQASKLSNKYLSMSNEY